MFGGLGGMAGGFMGGNALGGLQGLLMDKLFGQQGQDGDQDQLEKILNRLLPSLMGSAGIGMGGMGVGGNLINKAVDRFL